MIVARISDINGQGSMLYVQIYTSKGSDNTTAELYLSPGASIAVQHASIADACRQALDALAVPVDVDEPVRLLGGIVEIV